MSSGLLPRQCKTKGHSGFENDLEDLESELLAAFVAIDVPAAFCAPEVFVDAAMIASDSWVSVLGAALSAFDDAVMLCSQESMWNDDSGASSFLKIDGFGDVSYYLLECYVLWPILDRPFSSLLVA